MSASSRGCATRERFTQQQQFMGVWSSARKVGVDVGPWLEVGIGLVVVEGRCMSERFGG